MSMKSYKEAELEFERAWNDPRYTKITLEDVDVNKVLQEHYDLSRPLVFTQEMLWDCELRKSWDPMTYIHHVVKEAHSWNKTVDEEGNWIFLRSSQQRQWKTGEHALVIEEVYQDRKQQLITFLGSRTAKGEDGSEIKSDNPQALFHVQHGVTGEENRPLNTWRIVHLTDQVDPELEAIFNKFRKSGDLPVYIQVYVEQVLGITLKRK